MSSPEFRTLDEVEYGTVTQVSALIRRVIAQNPSKFTYKGTGTYIVGHGDVVVIDPGPRLDSHREALVSALLGERVRAILVTHCHADHSPLAAWLSERTGAPTFGFGPHPRPEPGGESPEQREGDPDVDTEIEESTDYDFEPTHSVVDGELVVSTSTLTMRAVHTPGHTSNHTCWTLAEESTLFTGDHVMGWSTTVVSPPDGDMAAYIDSLHRVAGRRDRVLWPTHGPSRDDGPAYVQSLVDHRLERERAVLAAVRAGHHAITEIVELLYADVRPELHQPAGRSVWSHLVKLVADGAVAVTGDRPASLDARYNAP